jgi:hypothetical protein
MATAVVQGGWDPRIAHQFLLCRTAPVGEMGCRTTAHLGQQSEREDRWSIMRDKIKVHIGRRSLFDFRGVLHTLLLFLHKAYLNGLGVCPRCTFWEFTRVTVMVLLLDSGGYIGACHETSEVRKLGIIRIVMLAGSVCFTVSLVISSSACYKSETIRSLLYWLIHRP